MEVQQGVVLLKWLIIAVIELKIADIGLSIAKNLRLPVLERRILRPILVSSGRDATRDSALKTICNDKSGQIRFRDS